MASLAHIIGRRQFQETFKIIRNSILHITCGPDVDCDPFFLHTNQRSAPDTADEDNFDTFLL